MRFTTIYLTAAAASSATATMFRVAANTINYPWDITGWNADCTGGECQYKFTLTAEGNATAKPATPSVKAECSGEGEGAPYSLCTVIDSPDTPAEVAAKLLVTSSNSTTNGTYHATIQVSVEHMDLRSQSTFWNYSGVANTLYNGLQSTPLSFEVVPNEVWGIA